MLIDNIKKITSIANIHPISSISKKVNNIYDTYTKKNSVETTLETCIEEILKLNKLNILESLKKKALLKKLLPNILKSENYINEGKDAIVYRINDNYIAKVSKHLSGKDPFNIFSSLTRPHQIFDSIEMYYGLPVIKIGQFEILKNAIEKGKNVICGLSYSYPEGKIPPNEIEKYLNEFLPYCSSLPQKSYDEFAYGLKKINELSKIDGMVYNPDIFNPNNILICNGHFKIVDEMNKSCMNTPNNLYSMLVPLLIKVSAYNKAEHNPAFTSYRKIIYNKCLTAAKNAGLNVDDENILKTYYKDIVDSILELK